MDPFVQSWNTALRSWWESQPAISFVWQESSVTLPLIGYGAVMDTLAVRCQVVNNVLQAPICNQPAIPRSITANSSDSCLTLHPQPAGSRLPVIGIYFSYRILFLQSPARAVCRHMSRSKQKRAYHIFGRKWVFCTNILGHHWSYTTQNFRLIGQLFRYEIHAQVQVGAHNHSSDQHVTARNSKITLAHTDMCYSKSNIWYTAISQFW